MYRHINNFAQLLEKYIPKVYSKFVEYDVLPEMYLTEWILSFMCAYIPITWLCQYFNEFFEHGWLSFYAICLAIHEFLQDIILEGYDMPSVLICMKEMKENRDSLYCHTQIEERRPDSDRIKHIELTPPYKSETTLPLIFNTSDTKDQFSSMQRTKDEDWITLF